MWTALALLTAFALPGVSFLFLWPLAFAAVASLVRLRVGHPAGASVALWVATLVSTALVVPIAFDVGADGSKVPELLGRLRWLGSLGVQTVFGWVVGVDRTGQAEALRRKGADVVVRDLDELLERP